MKFFGILTAAICALALGVNAAPPSAYGSSLEAHIESRVNKPQAGGSRPPSPAPGPQDTPGLAKLKSFHSGMVASTQYVFMLTVGPGGNYDHGEAMKAYCERVGYKHKSLIIGEVKGQEFKATEWDLRKAVTTSTVSVGKEDWKYQDKPRNSYQYVGATTLSETKILEHGKLPIPMLEWPS